MCFSYVKKYYYALLFNYLLSAIWEYKKPYIIKQSAGAQ